MTLPKFVSMFKTSTGEKLVVDMVSRDKETKTYMVYTASQEWHRLTRKEILSMEEVLPSPECNAYMEFLVDEHIIHRRWQYQVML